MEARSEFPRLVRNLIRRNNDQLAELEMRAAEGTGSSGFDGVTRAARATPFVPEGLAVWELGVGVTCKDKANSDYAKRCADPLGRDPGTTTFVFVNPGTGKIRKAGPSQRRLTGYGRMFERSTSTTLTSPWTWLPRFLLASLRSSVNHLTVLKPSRIGGTDFGP